MTSPTDGWILYDANNKVIGSGTGYTKAGPGERLEYSRDPKTEPATLEMEANIQSLSNAMNVEDWKSEQEYSGKEENATRWLANNPAIIGDPPLILRALATLLQIEAHDVGDYKPESYPWMYIEIDAKGITPRECAESILAAVKRADDAALGTWEKARRRVALREQLRAESE